MLTLCEEAPREGIAIDERIWCSLIGFPFPNNLRGIRDGKRNFTIEQIIAAAKLHHTSTDWILGLTELKEPFPEKVNGIKLIEEGIRLLKNRT